MAAARSARKLASRRPARMTVNSFFRGRRQATAMAANSFFRGRRQATAMAANSSFRGRRQAAAMGSEVSARPAGAAPPPADVSAAPLEVTRFVLEY